jgi:hypothetical protein
MTLHSFQMFDTETLIFLSNMGSFISPCTMHLTDRSIKQVKYAYQQNQYYAINTSLTARNSHNDGRENIAYYECYKHFNKNV